MKLLMLNALFFLTLNSCHDKAISTNFHIKGFIDNFNRDSIFIAQANLWNKPIAWTAVVKGKFDFHFESEFIKKNNLNLASLGYIQDGKIKIFEFLNEILTREKPKYFHTAFIIDSSEIEVVGNMHIGNDLRIKSGLETKALYRTQMMQFGYFDINPKKRTEQLDEYISIIKEYPNSQYLLFQINENKSALKKAELKAMLNAFSLTVFNTELGSKLLDFEKSINSETKFENITLIDDYGKLQPTYNSLGGLNMLIIWASWCSPCRKEIPMLKRIYTAYSTKGLNISSISIDENETLWRKAILQEGMPWRQLIVPKEKLVEFSNSYKTGAIPDILFLDNNGVLKHRFIGINTQSYQDYIKIIEDFFSKK